MEKSAKVRRSLKGTDIESKGEEDIYLLIAGPKECLKLGGGEGGESTH